MILMKFGGSSLADPERIRAVGRIVRARMKDRPVVVVSAFRGVTDALLQAAQDALRGDLRGLVPLKRRHLESARALKAPASLVEGLFSELEGLLRGVSLLKELTPRTLDRAASFGERLSARLVAAHFIRQGLKARAVDAFDAGLLTDDRFGGANPLPRADRAIRRHLGRARFLPVLTGFIGKTASGDITTLGRNGSDYSATIFGAALGAREVQIWSDTDGVMTADPRLVPDARPIAELSFSEASELAYYGGKVLHPHTLLPAVRKGIPIRVLNTFKPDHPGTAILAERSAAEPGARSISFKKRQRIVSVSSPRMVLGAGFLGRIFGAFGRHDVAVDMVSTSEVTVSASVGAPRGLAAAISELKGEFRVRVEEGRSVICIVGDGIGSTPGVAGTIFEALREAKVNVEMISQGASEINIAFVVRDADCPRAVRALHRSLFS
ncbi:MAG: aspartate kinase [Elusimicrobiota bacterium]